MSSIRFQAKPFKICSWTILLLPKNVSAKLPSRGMTMVKGTINSVPFQTPLEPDGRGSHWFRIDKATRKATGAKAGDTTTLTIEPTNDWPVPKLPADFKKALSVVPQANSLWERITPNAQWDWIRWIRSTKQPETRKRRIKVACSKLNAGTRRPCCFNRNLCTEPYVSNSWILLSPK